MLSTIWMIPWSVMGFEHYDSSLVMFEEPVTKMKAEAEAEKGRVMFETHMLTPEEEDSIVQSMRKTFE